METTYIECDEQSILPKKHSVSRHVENNRAYKVSRRVDDHIIQVWETKNKKNISTWRIVNKKKIPTGRNENGGNRHLQHGRRCSRHDGPTRGTKHCCGTTGSKPNTGGYLFDGENVAARRRRCWCGGCDDGDGESEYQTIDLTGTSAHQTRARKLIRKHWNDATAAFNANSTRAHATLTPMCVRYEKLI